MSTLEEKLKEIDQQKEQRAWPFVEDQVKYAIEAVERRDSVLLEDDTNERAVAHRLAVYLEERFYNWNVDCEFNRQGEAGARDTKRAIPSLPLLPATRGSQKATVIPDIIVHKRQQKENLLVVEVKPAGSDGIERDRVKLRQFLTDPDLEYAHAVLLTYRVGQNAGFEPIEVVRKDTDSGKTEETA